MMVLGGNIIVMCGAGAVGSNLLYNLCADRRSWKFFVIDYDKVEAVSYTHLTLPTKA